MALIVQKYGGSSIADAEGLKRVASRVLETANAGNSVVVVVSAMGKTTDGLIALANQVTSTPCDREMDMLLSTGEQVSIALLAMALNEMGASAVSLTGPQAGICTDSSHLQARIREINPERILCSLKEGGIVIIAGFQGLTPAMDVATLGRGGSDTTAVAVAAAIKADLCQIYTDVEGVYSADPRIVKDARKLDELAYDEMLELAGAGAKVLMSRSVEYAKRYDVRLEVLSSFVHKPGTIVKKEVKKMENVIVRGISSDVNQVKFTISGMPGKPGTAAKFFQELAGANINVDMIIQNIAAGGNADISLTNPRTVLAKANNIVKVSVPKIGLEQFDADEDIAKVSIVGVGMRGNSGVAYRMFKCLADLGITIVMISTSEIKISVIIEKDKANEAMIALHKEFNLSEEPETTENE
ncbi:MAG: aspartate kinase [Lentisphaerae bacterium]|nr:aspartate kinase [Lentisphaerota bacterium]